MFMLSFSALGVLFGSYQFLNGESSRGLLGLFSVAFFLIPVIVKALLGGHPYLLYIELYAFCILAYDVGCVLQCFDRVDYLDKISHFLSGFMFTALGCCMYLYLAYRNSTRASISRFAGISYAVFFSSFVAVFWEICEFLGFILAGHDSQHHLTTGVFDTMYDLITCFAGSLLCALSLALYRKGRVRLPANAIAGEVLDILEEQRASGRGAGGTR